MSEELATFLNHIWGPEDNTVFLASKSLDNIFSVSNPLVWPTQKKQIVAGIMASNIAKDTYFTPGTFKPNATTKHKDNGLRARVLWVDIDGHKDTQDDPETALQRLVDAQWLPLPSYRLQTSKETSQHWYWLLDDYYPAEIINDLNRRLTYFLKADKACWDISHVMRPPFTINHKPEHVVDGISPTVDIIEFIPERYQPSNFEGLPSVLDGVRDSIELGELPTLESVFMRYPWDAQHSELFKREVSHFLDNGEAKGRGMAMVRLAYFCAEIGMNDEAIYVVIDDVDRRWGKFIERRDREYQLLSIIKKARNKYPSALIVEVVDDKIEDKFSYGFLDFLKSKFEFKWILENFLPENTINFITGRPGEGKSRYVLQLCGALALGKDFLGHANAVGKQKVLFLSLEMGPSVLKKFMGSLAKDSEYTMEELHTLNDNFIVVPAGEALAISSQGGKAFMDAMMEERKPDIVVIDAMGSLDYADLTESVSKEIMNTLKRYLNEHKITIYLVHHNRKPDTTSLAKPPSLSDFYGNTYGATDAASIVSLWRNPKTSVEEREVELHTLKSRIGTDFRPLILDGTLFQFRLKDMRTQIENARIPKQKLESSDSVDFSFGRLI